MITRVYMQETDVWCNYMQADLKQRLEVYMQSVAKDLNGEVHSITSSTLYIIDHDCTQIYVTYIYIYIYSRMKMTRRMMKI